MPAGQSESLTQSCCCPLMHAFPSWHTAPPPPNGKLGRPPLMQQTCPAPQLPGAVHGSPWQLIVVLPTGKPPTLLHACGEVQSELDAQTRLKPTRHEPTWQDVLAAPPGKPPPAVQHTSPALQLPTMQGGGLQVMGPPPPGKPVPAQVCPPGHSLVLVHSCVEPDGQEAMHDGPLPPPNGPPPPPSPLGTWQQTSLLAQLIALEHDATKVVPVGHWFALDTQE
jgi:hypothetical protein